MLNTLWRHPFRHCEDVAEEAHPRVREHARVDEALRGLEPARAERPSDAGITPLFEKIAMA
jgi:hypothetical protein